MIGAIKAMLLPRCDVELRASGVQVLRADGSKKAKLVRLDRGLCRHTSIKRVEGASFLSERRSMRLKARATAPFHNSDFAILWGQTRASVYFWDRDRVKSDLRTHGIALADDGVVLPSIFFEAAGHNVELRRHESGVELQIWDGGALQHSRWWNEPPAAAHVEAFIDQLDLEREIQIPAMKEGERTATPALLSWHNGWDYLLMFRPHMVALAIGLNVLAAGFAAGGYSALWQSEAKVVANQASIKPQELQVVEARKRAIELRGWIEHHETLRDARQHIHILDGFLQAIDASVASVQLDAWEYENGQLSATLKVKGEINIRDLVQALETHRLFTGVNSESNAVQKNIKLSMTVVKGGKP